MGSICGAVWPTVTDESVFKFCSTATDVMILRPKWASEENKKEYNDSLVKRLDQYRGLPYDTLFGRGPERLYCAEMIWRLFPWKKFDWSDVHGVGFEYLTPDGVASCKDFEPLYFVPKVKAQ